MRSDNARGALTTGLDASTNMPRMAAADRLEDVRRRHAFARDAFGRNVPDARNALDRDRIVDETIARELIGFLTVLAAALTVALARERAVAAALPAGQSEREREIDVSARAIRTVAVLLDAARGDDQRAARIREHARRRANIVGRNAGAPLGAFGIFEFGVASHVGKARRSRSDVARCRCDVRQ